MANTEIDYIIDARQLSKSFDQKVAVDNVSLQVKRGEIFGLLGPNGAGKTTIIRMLLNIYQPDQGTVSILGGPMDEEKKRRIGYIPEERGLYQDITLERCLIYLALLKGMTEAKINSRLETLLEEFDLIAHRKRKLKELSKGMQQKAQIIASVLHKPELLIIDEPFSGLDPINSLLVKNLLYRLKNEGTTVVMSTHQLPQVEEMCEHIVLIANAKIILQGDLDAIRRPFMGSELNLRIKGELPQLGGVLSIEKGNNQVKLKLAENHSPQEILQSLISQKIEIEKFEIAAPSLQDIYIQAVKNHQA